MTSRRLLHVWLLLALLTSTSFLVAIAEVPIHGAAWFLGLAAVKAAVLGWHFMDLRTAHRAWPAALAVFLLVWVALLLGLGAAAGSIGPIGLD